MNRWLLGKAAKTPIQRLCPYPESKFVHRLRSAIIEVGKEVRIVQENVWRHPNSGMLVIWII
jgi:hypothetical protein